MIAQRIDGATRFLGAPKGWEEARDGFCGTLPIRDIAHDGLHMMVSAWEPTPEELALINAGRPIYLRVVGVAHPPVMVFVEAADAG